LVRKTFHLPANKLDKAPQPPKATSKNHHPFDNLNDVFAGQDIVVLNNDDPNENRLNLLLGINANDKSDIDQKAPATEGKCPAQFPMNDIKVDVTLRSQLGQAPALMLLITDPKHQQKGESITPTQISICFEVGLNGHISVVETAGLSKENGTDTEMQEADSSANGVRDVHKKIARVLEVSQDLGILVEWVLRWLQQRTGNE
jgi:hypothetical protein